MINGSVVEHIPQFDPSDESMYICEFAGCSLVCLRQFSDSRGWLVPVWSENKPESIYFYYSVTRAGVSRDSDKWHLHERHTDRFVVMSGTCTLALSDGVTIEKWILDGHAPMLAVIRPGVYHAIEASRKGEVILLNFPDEVYDPEDELRVPFTEVEGPW